ncbi:MAG: ribonuclease H [Promethearchaeota archaeon]
MQVEIWTDGACLGNPGPGGWAFRLILKRGVSQEIIDVQSTRPYPLTTNNRMELRAILNALKKARQKGATPKDITVYSDSEWAIKCILREYDCTKDKTSEQYALLQKIWQLDPNEELSFIHVQGHQGLIHNEMVDKLARESIRFSLGQ